MSDTSAELIAAYNAGRDPSRLALKYKNMRGNAFVFLRGTAHLFHRRLAAAGHAPSGPVAWIDGDMHVENFGTYLGGNGLTYFDVNDFDECALAPCTWDIVRLATSLLVAAPGYGIDNDTALTLASDVFETYRAELAKGKPNWIERKTADGVIGDLFEKLKDRDDKKFVLKRTVDKQGKRLDTDAPKMQAIANASEVEAVRQFVEAQVSTPGGSKLYVFKDVAYRIAGTGSLGVHRYVVLAQAVGTDRLLLLDLKESLPSSAAPVSPSAQPKFDSEAHRIATIQGHAQTMPPALLHAVEIDKRPYVLKELQPSSDRLNLADVAENAGSFAAAVHSMAALAAWSHLRASGHLTAPPADSLAAFAADAAALKGALPVAQAMERTTLNDWQDYCRAYDGGAFDAVLKRAAPGKGDE